MKFFNVLPLLLFAAACQSPAAPSVSTDGPIRRVVIEGLELELERARHLFTDDFARSEFVHGELVERPLKFAKDCYWNGGIRGDVGSRVAVRACESDFSDLKGIILGSENRWFAEEQTLRPLRSRVGECGTTSRASLTMPGETPVTLPAHEVEHRAALSTGQPRFIEMLIAEDSVYGAEPAAVDDTVLMVHLAAALYDDAAFDDRIIPVLTAVIDTDGSDPWGAAPTSNGEALSSPYLDNFNAWLETTSSLPEFDVAALFTGWDLDGLTVGLANVEGACDPVYSGVLVDAVGGDEAVSQTLAHEIGHTIGLEHDGVANSCDAYDFIMTSIYTEGGPYPTEFSTCSLTEGSRWLRTGAAHCIDFVSQPAHDGPDCGDGLVEGNERCDCGPLGCAGRDPCCDEATCQLKAGATCSVADGCCDDSTCSPVSADDGVTCRAARSDCDVPEVCNGGAVCPPDAYRPTGEACTDDLGWSGACMTGICATRGSICEALTEDYVLDPVPYDEMCADAGCDVMECVYDNACVFTSYGTPDGTPCGAGQQCWQGSCVASSTLPGADGCGAPDLDTDGDGTRDCDDDCPLDPDAVETPCAEPDPAPDPNNSSGANNANNGGGPNNVDGNNGQNPGQTGGDDPIVIVDDNGSGGCSTPGSAPMSLWLVVVLGWFRRRGRRTSACPLS